MVNRPTAILNNGVYYPLMMMKIALPWLFLSVFGVAVASTESDFVPLEEHWSEGPWRGVSQLVLFDNRLWFINSNPFKDTNAADLYSLQLSTAEARYEQSLFSQDVGNPVVYEGQLYLPFEDPRRSAGRGEYALTDGSRFDWRSFPDGRAFHVHAMGECQGRLMAVTGAFSGQLQVYESEWQLLVDYPKGAAGFSRMISIMPFGDECLFGAMARGDDRPKLLRLLGDEVTPVSGWPSGDRAETAVVFDGQALAFNDQGDTRSLFAWDGSRVKEIKLPDGRARALSVDEDQIVLITSDQTGGSLWFADRGFEWQLQQRFDTTPISLLSSQGLIFVGTWSKQGGALFSNSIDANIDTPPAIPLFTKTPQAIDFESVTQRVDTWWDILSTPLAPDTELDQLRDVIEQLELDEHPVVLQSLAAKVESLPVTGTQKMFGSRELDRSSVIRWYINTTAAVRGVASPSLDQIARPFTRAENSAAKYFDDTVAAIVGVGRYSDQLESPGQPDNAKLVKRLIERLQSLNDPLWLQGDIIGALTRLTDQRFAYDKDGWANWSARQK